MKKKYLDKKINIFQVKILKNRKGNIFKISRKKSKIRDCYISCINRNNTKAWRYHNLSEQRIFVISGKCKVIILLNNKFQKYIMSEKTNKLLTIPNKCWYGFKNIGKKKVKILNMINIHYSESEIKRKKINEFDYDWAKN